MPPCTAGTVVPIHTHPPAHINLRPAPTTFPTPGTVQSDFNIILLSFHTPRAGLCKREGRTFLKSQRTVPDDSSCAFCHIQEPMPLTCIRCVSDRNISHGECKIYQTVEANDSKYRLELNTNIINHLTGGPPAKTHPINWLHDESNISTPSYGARGGMGERKKKSER